MARREETPGPRREPCMVRLGDDERSEVAAAAARSGERVSTYIRRVALESARRELAGT